MSNRPESESNDKAVLITGASAGIGRQLALQCAARGMRVAITARREERLQEVAAECQASGAGDVNILPADLAEKQACYQLIDQLSRRWGQLDILFNNAGFAVSSELAEVDDIQLFEQVMDVNFRASMWLTHAALPLLIESGGRICGISSVAGLFSMAGSSSYNASKFAMRGFFDALRQELKEKGVSVTMIYPGYVVTEFASRVQDASGAERGGGGLSIYKPHMMSAERCARISIEATLKRKRQKVFTFAANLARWVQLLAPGLIDSVIARHRRNRKNSHNQD